MDLPVLGFKTIADFRRNNGKGIRKVCGDFVQICRKLNLFTDAYVSIDGISLTDPDARSMATGGRGSGIVGYNLQAAVDTKHHLIVAHEVTNVGNDPSTL